MQAGNSGQLKNKFPGLEKRKYPGRVLEILKKYIFKWNQVFVLKISVLPPKELLPQIIVLENFYFVLEKWIQKCVGAMKYDI